MAVQWQVRYFERGIPYWWDYPPEVNGHLEAIKDVVGDVFTEWTYQYPAKRTRTYPSGTFVINDDDDAGPVVAATYHLYPRKKRQINITEDNGRARKMRRNIVDEVILDDEESLDL